MSERWITNARRAVKAEWDANRRDYAACIRELVRLGMSIESAHRFLEPRAGHSTE